MSDEFECRDCQINTSDIDEYYMVHDHVWLASRLPKDGGMLCIGCLERRIGRKLTPSDFRIAPINQGFFTRSARLLDRLGQAPKINE